MLPLLASGPGHGLFLGESSLDQPSDYVMLALVPPPEFVRVLADPQGEPAEEHHVTLFFLGTTEDVGGEEGRRRLEAAVLDFCAHSGYRGLTGRFGGYGVFPPSPGSDKKHVLFALWNVPGLAEFRTWLGRYLESHGVLRQQEEYGFVPHETIRYSDEPIRELPDMPEGLPESAVFGAVYLVWAGDWCRHELP